MRRVKSPTRLLPGFRNDKVAVALPQLEPAKAGVDIRTENGRSRSAKWIWAVLLFWGVPDGNSGVAFGKLRLFISYNYTGVLAGIAAWLTVQFGGDPGWVAIAAMVGLGWVVTVVMGTSKYIGWLVSILNRWPPMGRA